MRHAFALALVAAGVGLLAACADDDNGVGPGTDRPTYTLVDSVVWAGSDAHIAWTDGDIAPTAVYLDTARVSLTLEEAGLGSIPIPSEARGPMQVRIVTGEHEDTLTGLRVLGAAFHRPVADGGLFGFGFPRTVDGVASVVAWWSPETESVYAAELLLPGGTVTPLLPASAFASSGEDGPGQTPDSENFIVMNDEEQYVEWQTAPEPHPVDTLPALRWHRVVQRMNDTMYVASDKRYVSTFAISDGTRRWIADYEFSEGEGVRPSPDFRWFMPRTWSDELGSVGVFSTGTGQPAFRIPIWRANAVGFDDASSFVYVAGPAGPDQDSIFAYRLSDARSVARREFVADGQTIDMVVDPVQPLVYVFSLASSSEPDGYLVHMTILDRYTLDVVGRASSPVTVSQTLWSSIATIDDEHVYLVTGSDIVAFDRAPH